MCSRPRNIRFFESSARIVRTQSSPPCLNVFTTSITIVVTSWLKIKRKEKEKKNAKKSSTKNRLTSRECTLRSCEKYSYAQIYISIYARVYTYLLQHLYARVYIKKYIYICVCNTHTHIYVYTHISKLYTNTKVECTPSADIYIYISIYCTFFTLTYVI